MPTCKLEIIDWDFDRRYLVVDLKKLDFNNWKKAILTNFYFPRCIRIVMQWSKPVLKSTWEKLSIEALKKKLRPLVSVTDEFDGRFVVMALFGSFGWSRFWCKVQQSNLCPSISWKLSTEKFIPTRNPSAGFAGELVWFARRITITSVFLTSWSSQKRCLGRNLFLLFWKPEKTMWRLLKIQLQNFNVFFRVVYSFLSFYFTKGESSPQSVKLYLRNLPTGSKSVHVFFSTIQKHVPTFLGNVCLDQWKTV